MTSENFFNAFAATPSTYLGDTPNVDGGVSFLQSAQTAAKVMIHPFRHCHFLAVRADVNKNAVPPVTPAPNALQCPECPYRIPEGSRAWPSDLKRHIDTHFPSKWFCCGIPTDQAQQHGLKPGDGKRCERLGMNMVGGCGKGFSRRDAYKRHLVREGGKVGGCRGDPSGHWLRV